MTATLTRALKRRGAAALNGTKETLAVGGPGTLTQRVYTPVAPKSARTARAKPVLIASATRKFAAAGTGSLTLRMTAAGRRAPRGKTTLKIEIVTSFVPLRGSAAVSSKRLTIPTRTVKGAAPTGL